MENSRAAGSREVQKLGFSLALTPRGTHPGGSEESQGFSLTTPNIEFFKWKRCAHLFFCFLSEKWKLLKARELF